MKKILCVVSTCFLLFLLIVSQCRTVDADENQHYATCDQCNLTWIEYHNIYCDCIR